MQEEEENICESCHNVTDNFSMCENCGWIRCDNCFALDDDDVKPTDPGFRCPNCGSDKITIYAHGKKVAR